MAKRAMKLSAFFITLSLILSMISGGALAADDDAATLSPGIYTITANLYVPGNLNTVLPGVTAYLTNTSVPPTTPVASNATLSVADDGSMTLKIDTLNSVFTLQEIGGCSSAEIMEAPKDAVDYSGVTGRITSLSVRLKNAGGTYTFSECKEFPTLLGEQWNVPLTLTVDFNSAERIYVSSADEKTKTLTDAGTGISATIKSTSMTTDNLQLTVVKSQEDGKSAVKETLSKMYDSDPSFEIYTISLDTAMTGNTQAAISVPVSAKCTVYRVDGEVLTELKGVENKENSVEFSVMRLGTFVVLDISDNFKTVTITYPKVNGVSFTLWDTTRYMKTPEYFDSYVPLTPVVETVGENSTAYTIGFIKPESNYVLSTLQTATIKNPFKEGLPTTTLTLTVPYSSGQKAYFITEDYFTYASDGMSSYTILEELQLTPNNDQTATITVFKGTVTEQNNKTCKLNRGNSDKIISQMRIKLLEQEGNANRRERGYVLVTDKNILSMPSLNSPKNVSVTYKAAEYNNWKVPSGERQATIGGTPNATDVGRYPVTLTLPDGNCVWPDLTNQPKTLHWEITPRKLTAEYSGETILLGGTPSGTISYKSYQVLKNAGVIDQDRDFPIISFPENPAVGKYELTPTLPEGATTSDNFYWECTPGILSVLPAGANPETDKLADKPAAQTGLTYTGSELTGVETGEGYTLTGNTATEAGDYTATATLEEHYYWSDGTTEPLTIAWSIAKKAESSEEKTQTVTANLYLPGENNQVLPGVTVYLNNPNNPIQGTGTPITPQSGNASLKTAADGTRTLTLSIANPVFTLQSIGGCSNANIVDTKTSGDVIYQDGGSGKYAARVSEITVELLDDSGKYVFESCTEFPTLLGVDWNYPLILAVDLTGTGDTEPSEPENPDTPATPDTPVTPTGPTDPDTPGTPDVPADKTQTVTANLYLPGKDNQVLPGITVYLNNPNNPIQGTGTPTTPKSNNARLKTSSDGTRTLTLSITNPVFTLQAIGGCSNAKVVDTRTNKDLVYQGGGSGKYNTRISEITVELLDDSGEYVFNKCTEFPTLLGVEWNYPLILAVNFEGGTDSSLDSNTGVDTSGITGAVKPVEEELPSAELKPAATAGKDGVANVELTQKDLESALEKVGEKGGAIVIAPEIEGSATKVNVDLPKSSAAAMAKSGADLVVKTKAATVSIPAEGLAGIAKARGSTMTVTTEKTESATTVSIAVDGKTVEKAEGGIAVTLPSDKKSGNVLILVGSDGSETVVKKSIVDGNTVKALLDGSATVKVADRSKSFSDTAKHWAAEGIDFATSHELFQGVDSRRFAPDTTMSRAMLATVLYRLEDATEKGGGVFKDVAEGTWYADAVAWANAKGIVTGNGNGMFTPNDDVTREQLVAMLYRYAQHLGMDTRAGKELTAYTDAAAISPWASDAMKWAADKGLIAGRTNNTLVPGGTATRAETATILQRMVELIVK